MVEEAILELADLVAEQSASAEQHASNLSATAERLNRLDELTNGLKAKLETPSIIARTVKELSYEQARLGREVSDLRRTAQSEVENVLPSGKEAPVDQALKAGVDAALATFVRRQLGSRAQRIPTIRRTPPG